jgi:hypothetical protein
VALLIHGLATIEKPLATNVRPPGGGNNVAILIRGLATIEFLVFNQWHVAFDENRE